MRLFKKMIPLALAALLLVVMLAPVAAQDEPEDVPRLAFTQSPYAPNLDAVFDTFSRMALDSNLTALHFDASVPWDAAFANDFEQVPTSFREEVRGYRLLMPPDHPLYLAVNPLNAPFRDGLALSKVDGGRPEALEPWASYGFDNPDVLQAYINYCKLMIAELQPDYFAYAVEVNLYFLQATPDEGAAFLDFLGAVYGALKSAHPDLPIFVTIQADFYHHPGLAPGSQAEWLRQMAPYTDYLALSLYPFSNEWAYGDQSVADPSALPDDYFSSISAAINDSKPLLISETAWPAEDLRDPYPRSIASNPLFQAQYFDWLWDQALRFDMPFIVWFFHRDYDAIFDSLMRDQENADVNIIWRDTGLYDEDGNPRLILDAWRERLR